MKPELAALPLALEELQVPSPPGQNVLSVYLDTGPGRTDGPAYLFAFRDGSKALRHTTHRLNRPRSTPPSRMPSDI